MIKANNKGITLISLLVYIIVMTVVIGTVSSVMKYFYKNTNEVTLSSDTAEQYSRFVAYITDDTNSRKN